MNQFFNDALTRLQNATAPELTVLVLTGVLVVFFVLLLAACRTNRRLDEECDALDAENDELRDEVDHIQHMGEGLFLEYTKLTLQSLKERRRHLQLKKKLESIGIEVIYAEDMMDGLDRLFRPQCGGSPRGEAANEVIADEFSDDGVQRSYPVDAAGEGPCGGEACAGNSCGCGSDPDSGG
jgi:hypothetical protein